MDIQQRHQIEHECERLVYKWLRLFEHEHSKVAEMFTEDAVWRGTENAVKGRDAIRETFLRVEKHAAPEVNTLVATNVVIDVIDENNATGEFYVTHYQHIRQGENKGPYPLYDPNSIGRWVDEYKRVNGEWKIALRTLDTFRINARHL